MALSTNRDIHERSLTHRLAFHLELSGFFAGYNIDCEYNRRGTAVKKNIKDTPTLPDIIVHVRGSEEANLIILEAKKFNDPIAEINQEKKNLEINKRHLNYQHAFFVLFPENINDLVEDCVVEIV